MNDLGFVDRIYECVALPDLWPGVLDELSGIAGARGGALFCGRPKITQWVSSGGIRDVAQRIIDSDVVSRTSRVSGIVKRRHVGFLREIDMVPLDMLALDPAYPEFLWPAGLGYVAATAIQVPSGDQLILTLERDGARGPVEDKAIAVLDALRPHLARSALLSARLQLERARAASDTLALLGLPGFVLDPRGIVLAANDLAEGLVDLVGWRSADRLWLKDARADVLFRSAISMLESDPAAAARSFAVRTAPGGAAAVAHVVPLRGTARDLFLRCAAILVFTPVKPNIEVPEIDLVQSLFDLTASEARVAQGVAEGYTIAEIAARRTVSQATVRTQMRAVFEKTGCSRQAEVVALLSDIPLSRTAKVGPSNDPCGRTG